MSSLHVFWTRELGRRCVLGNPTNSLFCVVFEIALRMEEPVKNRLRVLRAEQGWSQAELAKVLDVSRQSVNAIETGRFDPSLPLAFKLARLFCPSKRSSPRNWCNKYRPALAGLFDDADGTANPQTD
jgi:putative transcriptional regulator